ncbi:MAG: Sec-independent protein translocase subunit TatA/TatB [Pirellulaceae bacterium]
MFGIGHLELMVVALVGLVLFGHRLPKVMRSLGQSITEFKSGLHDTSSDETPKSIE